MAGKRLANRDLTSNERLALHYYTECLERDGVPPTVAAIARHLQLTHNSGKWLLDRLVLKGYLKETTKKVTITRLKPTKKKHPV